MTDPSPASPTIDTDSTPRVPDDAPPIPIVVIFFLAVLLMVSTGLVGIYAWAKYKGVPPKPLPMIGAVPEFSLTNFDGSTVTRADFEGSPWIADFIFTRCVAICPRMTREMLGVAESLERGVQVRIASFSVDPEHDTPEVLSDFAERHGATSTPVGDDWYFLTGEVDTIDSLTRDAFLLPLDRQPPAEMLVGPDPIIHSNRFVLVDSESKIRGYYDAFDPESIEKLLDDAARLSASARAR